MRIIARFIVLLALVTSAHAQAINAPSGLEPEHGRMVPGRTYAFGPYYPKSRPEHWNSSWTQLVLRAKRRDIEAVTAIANIVAAHLRCWLHLDTEYVFCSVPTERTVSKYTQKRNSSCSALLAIAICAALSEDFPVDYAAPLTQRRLKESPQHACSSASQRYANVRECYTLADGRRVHGRVALLVDDIITTGATMGACARALGKAGSMGVIGIAAARTVKWKR